MAAKKTNAPVVVETPVEIIFNFTKVDLFDFLDLMEMSARSQEEGASVNPAETMKFIRMLRAAFVSSSRPLNVSDFNDTIKAFWKSAELFKNPNA